MTTLALMMHADPGVRATYLAAMREAGLVDVDLVFVNRSGLSQAYAQVARELRARPPGTLLERLCRQVGALAPATYRRVVVISYSAGYGLARELLEEPESAAQVDAYVALDSVHDSAQLARLGWLERYARVALAGDAVLWLGHTDVDPVTYASTGDVARELCRRVGLDAPAPGAHTERMGLRVASYDTRPPAQARGEHGAALTEWGPAFVAGAVARAVALDAERDTTPDLGPAWPELRLGLRCLDWLGYQVGSGVREIPGPRHDPRILAMSRHCRRGGRLVGVSAPGAPLWAGGVPLPLPRDEDAWCAAAQSAALLASLRPGETPPHGLRVSVRELVEDARAGGTLRPLEYEPQPGDLAILARAGGDPMRGGQGHVRAVVQVAGQTYTAIGGNEADAMRFGQHRFDDAALRAWIAR